MKRLSTFCIVACLTVQVSAQSLLSYGARGGLDFINPRSEQAINSKLGYAGAFDLGYTYYWPLRGTDLGIHTGTSIGYANSGIECSCEQQYTNYDYLNNEMIYTTSGTYTNSIKRVFLEVPLMAALRKKGFVAQIGVKAQMNVYSTTTQDVRTSMIDAYYVPFAVHVVNEVITGVVPQEELHKEFKGNPTLSLLIAGRIGYEMSTRHNSKIGFLAYVDYNVVGGKFSSYRYWKNDDYNKSDSQIDIPIIMVSPITDADNPVPTVTVNNIMESIVARINPLQVGISIYYALEWSGESTKKKQKRK